MKHLSKRGQMGGGLNLFVSLAIGLAVVAVTIALTIILLSKFADVTTDADAINVTNQLKTEVKGLVGWISIFIIVIVAVAIIGLVMYLGRTKTQ